MSYITLFDLDETIISCKSLFEVFKSFVGDNKFIEVMNNINVLRKNGVERQDVNRAFFSYFKGIDRQLMYDNIKAWLDQNCLHPEFFNTLVLNELERHQNNGSEVIIVSGSFHDCVNIIAHYLKVSHFICTIPEVKEGYYTGRLVGEPVIGKRKAITALDYIKNMRLRGDIRYAYGDHPSDLPMLKLAKYPKMFVAQDSEFQ